MRPTLLPLLGHGHTHYIPTYRNMVKQNFFAVLGSANVQMRNGLQNGSGRPENADLPRICSVNGDQNFGARGIFVEVEDRIQGEKLERVMMERPSRGRAGAQVAEFAVVISDLDGSVGES